MEKYSSIDAGVIPVDIIRLYLGVDVLPGRVWASGKAHQHIAQKHEADYPIVFHSLKKVVEHPDYIGWDPGDEAGHRHENFYLIKAIFRDDLPEGIFMPSNASYVLIAIALAPDAKGRYRVKSGYRVTEAKIKNRLRTIPSRLHKIARS
ncbi:hypothetical protein [Pararhodospirillum oryzae]|uniref:Phage-Barnase-EndoU-ColicinE5/D-RelE like nuclease 3 domain-containing protein n=1 Tax=Pararhodospirillum oryzae TaxID=478448 RepID=A0A512H8C5_9PROT|nr:hypothetical protein [Pararhodospirillum oryzae]GEO81678.1 hypothetical protein ROR02_18090 [Pararhodospirillum oryzae]